MDVHELRQDIDRWAHDLGFDQVGVTDTDLSNVSQDYREWLRQGFHGEMSYMNRNIKKRVAPHELLPGTVRVISARMNYLTFPAPTEISDPTKAYISRYALGRDYHKVVRRRLAKIARKMVDKAGGTHRAFVDSAPVLEKPLAVKAGLGWVGKNTLVLNSQAGSYFFLGEIFTDIPLPMSQETAVAQCGSCKACLVKCPTDAFVAPGKLDARKCISYLTIELKGSIPIELRPKVGNRIFGCDDCQLICPWNRFASSTTIQDFEPRHHLEDVSIIDLLEWNESTFREKTEGMAIKRVNYSQWVRNLAVAAGNSTYSVKLEKVLVEKRTEMENRHDSNVVEHINWALCQLLAETQNR